VRKPPLVPGSGRGLSLHSDHQIGQCAGPDGSCGLAGSAVVEERKNGRTLCFAEHDLDMIVGLKAASLQTFWESRK
jgi:hypothetical protein